MGRNPEESRLSWRDLIGDLADALRKRGVVPMAYSSSSAPNSDGEAAAALGCTPPWAPDKWRANWPEGTVECDERMTQFQRHWEAVLGEWGRRWGDRVAAWWIDGCYRADTLYRHDDEPNFASFARALRAGNPQRLVAFNPGVCGKLGGFRGLTEHEDYIAGEMDHLVVHAWPKNPLARFMDGGKQLHALTYLGGFWERNDPVPRFSDEIVTGYTRHINAAGGAVTWEVPIEEDGSMPDAFRRQLAAVGRAVAE